MVSTIMYVIERINTELHMNLYWEIIRLKNMTIPISRNYSLIPVTWLMLDVCFVMCRRIYR